MVALVCIDGRNAIGPDRGAREDEPRSANKARGGGVLPSERGGHHDSRQTGRAGQSSVGSVSCCDTIIEANPSSEGRTLRRRDVVLGEGELGAGKGQSRDEAGAREHGGAADG